MHDVDTSVLTVFEGQLLDEDVIVAVREAGRRLREGCDPDEGRQKLMTRLAAIAAEVDRLTTAIATTGREIPSLVEALQARK